MNRIITIGREFGSGGREFGKRLAQELDCPYYDGEIIKQISERTQLAEEYLRQVSRRRPGYFFPITIGHTLQGGAPDYLLNQYAEIYKEQTNVIKEMAEKSDCVIVGRCADFILREMHPLRVFVYSEYEAKLERCRARATEGEDTSEKALRRQIRRVDKTRAEYYRYYTGKKWGSRENYDICINSASMNIKEAAHALALMIKNTER